VTKIHTYTTVKRIFSLPGIHRSPLARNISGHTTHSQFSKDGVGLLYLIVLFLFYAIFSLFADQRGEPTTICQFIAATLYALLLACVILTVFQSLRTITKFSPGARVEAFLLKVTNVYVVYIVSIGMFVHTA
jgi:hypothetical protein